MKYIYLLLFTATVALGQNLSPKEREIIAVVSQNNAKALAFLEQVVDINSGTLNLEGVRHVGKIFQKE